MTSQLPGVVVGGLVSLVVAVVLLFVQRYLRQRGELHPEARWVRGGYSRGESERREFEVKFFNERDVNVALWEIRLEFYEGGKRTAYLKPDFAGDSGRGPVGVLNLPSRVAIARTMGVTVEEDTLEAARETLRPLRQAESAWFVGVIPGGEEVRVRLPPWPTE
jgi:hypothetical protein